MAGWWFIRFERVNYSNLFCSCRKNNQNILHSSALFKFQLTRRDTMSEGHFIHFCLFHPPACVFTKVFIKISLFLNLSFCVCFLALPCINIKMNLLYSYAMLQFKLLLNGGCAPRVKVLLWFIDVWLWIHQLMPPWCKCITLNAAGVSRCLIEMDKNKKTKWQ